MSQPTIFIQIKTSKTENVIAMALKHVLTHFGAKVTEELVTDGVEADIAVTNSAQEASWIANQSKRTAIILAYLGKNEKQLAEQVVGYFPNRISAVPYVSMEDGQVEIVPYLLKLISEKSAG